MSGFHLDASDLEIDGAMPLRGEVAGEEPGVPPEPYRANELKDALEQGLAVFVTLSHASADALRSVGVPATSAAIERRWPIDLRKWFVGADVVLIRDNTAPGRTHADIVGASLEAVAARIRVLDLPGAEKAKNDASDWLAAGGTADALYDLVDQIAWEWGPTEEEGLPWEGERIEVVTPPAPPFVSKFGGGFAHDMIKATIARDWLIKGAVLARSFALVIGAPGCGKSFLELDFAMTAAAAAVEKPTRPEWFGRKIKPCGVVYLSAEGQEDFMFRVKAWLEARGTPNLRLPFFLIPSAVDMRSDLAATDTLIAEIKVVSAICLEQFGVPIEVVVVDTVNRALAGGNENASEVMGAFVSNCGRLREACGVSVIGVHHTPESKEGPAKARGHGSLHGATDAEIVVTKAQNGAPNSWKVTRMKAGPTGARHEFRLRSHKMGVDEDGDDITSCVVKPLGSEPSIEGAETRDYGSQDAEKKPMMTPDGRVILGDNLTLMMKALQAAIDARGADPPFGVRAPHGRKGVPYQQWLEEIVRAMPGGDADADKFRERCRKMAERGAVTLRRREIVGMDSQWVWRTNRRIMSVDRPASSERVENLSDPPIDLSGEVSASEDMAAF